VPDEHKPPLEIGNFVYEQPKSTNTKQLWVDYELRSNFCDFYDGNSN